MAPTKKSLKKPTTPGATAATAAGVKKSKGQKKQKEIVVENDGGSKGLEEKIDVTKGTDVVEPEETEKGIEQISSPVAASNSPYQLNEDQTLKASRALLKHIAANTTKCVKPNLLHDTEDPADNAETIWLVVTTKKYLTDKRKLKPTQIRLPHALLNPESTTVCLITKDPQRTYKDLVAAAELTSTVTKVIGYSKLRAKFKSFESRRQLCDSHDVFLADDRIVTMLPNMLGVTFYRKTSKVPIPVSFSGREISAANMKNQIYKALSSTYVHLAPADNTSIRVGLSSFTPEQVAENVEKVVNQLTNKISGGWNELRSIYIKATNSSSLPIYMTSAMYADEDVLTQEKEQARLQNIAKRAVDRKEKNKNKKLKIAERKGLTGAKRSADAMQEVEKVVGTDQDNETPKKKVKLEKAPEKKEDVFEKMADTPKKKKKEKKEGVVEKEVEETETGEKKRKQGKQGKPAEKGKKEKKEKIGTKRNADDLQKAEKMRSNDQDEVTPKKKAKLEEVSKRVGEAPKEKASKKKRRAKTANGDA